MERVCIYPKDIQLITGKSERWGRDIIRKIKQEFNKQEHQLVTIDEFCSYMGLDVATVKQCLIY
ncbi:MAG TPA: hypothetical protein PKK00_06195 [Bacteroidales bacterium]|nr:hypothetical protein [Bacteroidales bacterium]HPS16880.1 hypothetical protein [Bacteroidales bacterium]